MRDEGEMSENRTREFLYSEFRVAGRRAIAI